MCRNELRPRVYAACVIPRARDAQFAAKGRATSQSSDVNALRGLASKEYRVSRACLPRCHFSFCRPILPHAGRRFYNTLCLVSQTPAHFILFFLLILLYLLCASCNCVHGWRKVRRVCWKQVVASLRTVAIFSLAFYTFQEDHDHRAVLKNAIRRVLILVGRWLTVLRMLW